MIAVLNGEIIGITEDSIIVQVGGIGFLVFVPTEVRQKAHIGDKTYLHTYLVVREDALSLYGFEREEEREFFLLLMGVNGVGPRVSLSIISTLTIDAIRRAVLSEQPEIFSRVPGVGKKTAQKIALHLQDKVGDAGLERIGLVSDVDTEVMEALTTLGYSVVEAQSALQSIPRETPQDVEERLRVALKYFSN